MALGAVASAQASVGDIEAALSTAHAIENENTRTSALTEIAAAQLASGNPVEARKTFADALAAAQAMTLWLYRESALVEIARAQTRAGDIEAALATAQVIEDLQGTRARILGEIATAQTAAGDVEGARATC